MDIMFNLVVFIMYFSIIQIRILISHFCQQININQVIIMNIKPYYSYLVIDIQLINHLDHLFFRLQISIPSIKV